ncbi:hypothetical protein ACKWTF_016458 [Chironomus riparius]
MGDEDEPLKGFSWRSGSDRDTTGIVIWNDVFLYTDQNTDEKIAIIVIDTQGLFDNQGSPMENSKIFAIGTLISSIQIMNLSGVIQADQLQYLQFATAFAKFSDSNNSGSKTTCFQNLVFVIRDWDYPFEYDYGFKGGAQYLHKFLSLNYESKIEIKSVQDYINESFQKISCTLLPHPGKIVTGTQKINNQIYNGSHRGMDADFKTELAKTIEFLFQPKNLVLKKINGYSIAGGHFYKIIENFFNLFNSNDLPEVQTIYDSMIEQELTFIVNSCFEKFKEFFFEHKDLVYVEIKKSTSLFKESKSKALSLYEEALKIGNEDHHVKFKEELIKKIDKLYEEWRNQTEGNIKNLSEVVKQTSLSLEEKQHAERKHKETEKQANEELSEIKRIKANEDFTDAKKIEKIKIAEEKNNEELNRIAKMRELEIKNFEKQEAEKHQNYVNQLKIQKQILIDEFNHKIAKLNEEMEKLKAELEVKTQKYKEKLKAEYQAKYN